MDITYKALAGQTQFVAPGGVVSAVTVDGVTATFTAYPGGFILDDATAADDLVVATFDGGEGYVSQADVLDAVEALQDDVTAMQADVDTIVTNTTP